MQPTEIPTSHARDEAMRRLRRLTLGVAGAAAGAVAVFGAIGAATLPGQSDATASSVSDSSTSSSKASTRDGGASLQQPSTAPRASSSGAAHAVSGGS